MFFLSSVTVTNRDLAPGISAHDKNGNVIYGNELFRPNQTIGSISNPLIIPGNEKFRILKTNKSEFKYDLSFYIPDCSIIEEFYAYNLESIPTSTFFSGCTKLKKIFLPVCSQAPLSCFVFDGVKRDVFLFSVHNGLSNGFHNNPNIGYGYNINKIYIPTSLYSNWNNFVPLQSQLEIFSGVY